MTFSEVNRRLSQNSGLPRWGSQRGSRRRFSTASRRASGVNRRQSGTSIQSGQGAQKKTSMEEVNAWANYEETAKLARSLALRQHSPLRHRAVRRSIVAPVEHDIEEQTRPDLQTGHTSEYGTSWSKYFSKMSLYHTVTPSQATEEQTTEKELDPEVQEAIRGLFGVYFEGSYHSSQESGNANTIVRFWRSIRGTMPWLQPWIEEHAFLPDVCLFLELCLRGIGQVFFQNSPLSGLLILVGLLVQSTRVAVHGIIAVMSGNFLAYMLRFDRGLIRSGLFGYNSVLVGLALATFDNSEKHQGWYAPIPIASIIFASFSSVLFVFMGKLLVPYKSPPLTLPFNVATLTFLAASAQMARVQTGPVMDPSLPDYSNNTADTTITGGDFFAGVVRGIGQVYLANEISSGILIWAGIAVCSRISALSAFAGSAIGAATAVATGVESAAIEQGMYGFNASLTVTAMFMFYTPSLGAGILATLAGITTVFGQQALATMMAPFGLPFMTLPFCVVALPFIILQGTTKLVIPVPLATMTIPEDHLKRVNTLKEGFGFLMEAMDSARMMKSSVGRKSSRFISEISTALSAESSNSSKTPRQGFICGWCQEEEPAHSDMGTIVFDAMGDDFSGHLKLPDFVACLCASGLDDKDGLNFASLVFTQLDLDKNGSLERSEFEAFCIVSNALQRIRHHIARFVDFVDMDHNGLTDFYEINSALEYLGEEQLSLDDRAALGHMVGLNDHEDEFEKVGNVELINLVTVAKIEALAKAHRASKE